MDGKIIIDLTDDPSVDDAPSIPCESCNRKFATRQDFIAHQTAHKVEQAMAKSNKKNLSVLHKRKKNGLNASQIHRALIGACEPCMESTSFGARVSNVIEQTYLLRFMQLAALRRGGSSKTCVVDDGVGAGDGIRALDSFSKI